MGKEATALLNHYRALANISAQGQRDEYQRLADNAAVDLGAAKKAAGQRWAESKEGKAAAEATKAAQEAALKAEPDEKEAAKGIPQDQKDALNSAQEQAENAPPREPQERVEEKR